MAFDIAGGALGAGFGLIGGIFANRANRKARDRALAQEDIRTSIEVGNNAERTSQIVGQRETSLAARNVFGRSADALIVSDINDGLQNEESLLIQEFFNKSDIRAQASRNETNLLSAAIGGGMAGFQFGGKVDGFLQNQARERLQNTFNSGALPSILLFGARPGVG